MARASIKAALIGPLLLVVACSQLAPDQTETVQQAMRKACSPQGQAAMQNVLTTPELQKAWAFICAHVDSIAPVRVADQ